jgi:hypothetical protein
MHGETVKSSVFLTVFVDKNWKCQEKKIYIYMCVWVCITILMSLKVNVFV